MKYIKTYEESTEKYWQLPTTKEPYFSVGLRKIGMPESKIIEYVDMFKNEELKDIFIFNDFTSGWSYAGKLWKPGYDETIPTFMGKISMEEIERELDANKYNL